MSTSTVRLHRMLRAAPEKVYRAFIDPEAMVKWLPPNGFTGKVHHIDAKVGGTYKMVPPERIRHKDTFDDPSLPGEMETTVSLKQLSFGTEVHIVQEGIPQAIPLEACYLGWQQSLTLLAQLVEAEIPG